MAHAFQGVTLVVCIRIAAAAAQSFYIKEQDRRLQQSNGNLSCQQCTDCPPGTEKPAAGERDCTTCFDGYWQTQAGQALCESCPAGRAASVAPNTSTPSTCAICPAGRYSTPGQLCRTCNPGTWAAEAGMSACSMCPAGQVVLETDLNPALSKTCSPCGLGTTPAMGEWAAPASEFDIWNASWNATVTIHVATGGYRCLACPDRGWAHVEGMAQCVYCNPGDEITNYNGSGSYNASVNQTCVPIECAAGQVYDKYWSLCLALRDGHQPNTASGQGYYGNNFGTITNVNGTMTCPDDQYSRPGIGICKSCPAGRSVNSAKSGCIADNNVMQCGSSQVPLFGLVDQDCLVGQLLGATFNCANFFPQYVGLLGGDPTNLCPRAWNADTLAPILYRYCPATMQAALTLYCTQNNLTIANGGVAATLLTDDVFTLRIVQNVWVMGFQNAGYTIPKNVDSSKYPYHNNTDFMSLSDLNNEWFASFQSCEDNIERVAESCNSWYFLIACPNTCATRVFGTPSDPVYFRPQALTDTCDSMYVMGMWGNGGIVTPLNGYSSSFQMLTEDLKDCPYDQVGTYWNFQTGLQDPICNNNVPAADAKVYDPSVALPSDAVCAVRPIQTKLSCPAGQESVCHVSCSDISNYYKDQACCGTPAKEVGSGTTCAGIKFDYKEVHQCCGAPAKMIKLPEWWDVPWLNSR